MDLDAFQDEIGGISRYQVVVIFSSCLLAMGQMVSQSAIFIHAVPEHRYSYKRYKRLYHVII